MVDLRELCLHLAKLGEKPPSASARHELEEAIHSKWEGVQITAARALAAWGDERSLNAVRELLFELAVRPAHWSTAGALVEMLVPHISVSDLEWIFELYFERCRRENRFTLMNLFHALPTDKTVAALVARGRRNEKDAGDTRYVLGHLEMAAMMRIVYEKRRRRS